RALMPRAGWPRGWSDHIRHWATSVRRPYGHSRRPRDRIRSHREDPVWRLRMRADTTLWRIAADTSDYEAHDLSGAGAERTGGRWNRKGIPLVYTSSSRALACLETIAHLEGWDPLPLNRYLVQVNVPAAIWSARSKFDPTHHVGWDAEPAGSVSLDWGTEWAR